MKNRLVKVVVAFFALVALSSCSSDQFYKFKTAFTSNSYEAVVTVDTHSTIQWSAVALPYEILLKEGFSDPVNTQKWDVVEYALRKYAGSFEVLSGSGNSTFYSSILKSEGFTDWVIYVFRYKAGSNTVATYVDAFRYRID